MVTSSNELRANDFQPSADRFAFWSAVSGHRIFMSLIGPAQHDITSIARRNETPAFRASHLGHKCKSVLGIFHSMKTSSNVQEAV